jgi:hypothetical protein
MSSSKNNSPSKAASSSSNISPEAAAEIARLMRDPNALRDERSRDVDAEIAYLMRTPGAMSEGTQRGGGRGHYDPNQPRVPAGDPKGGQFASKGYRGRESGRGAANPRDAFAQALPFDGLFGEISLQESLISQNAFLRLERDHNTNPRSTVTGFPAGRFEFLSQHQFTRLPLPNGERWTLTATTYGRDGDAMNAGAYVTIRATPERPVVIQEIDGVVTVERR